MQKKESFLLSLDDEVLFNRLTDEQAGKLIKAIFLYEKTGETSNLEFGLDLAFTTIQVKLDKNREKYKAKCEKNKENANKRWEKYNRIGTHTNNADNDYDYDYDNDNDNSNDINKSDDSCVDDPILFYQKNISSSVSSYEKEQLTKMQQFINKELLILAMKIAIENNAKNIAYIKSIINNWKKQKVTNVDEALKVNEQYKSTKNIQNTKEFENSYSKETLESLIEN